MTRSTVMTTDTAAAPVTQVAYTAFGEVVLPAGGPGPWTVGGEAPAGHPRYGYDGGWGYESGLITLYGEDPTLPPIVLQHVGERWYQPDTGRFVQRDPIGILGGWNVYLYCGANPVALADPLGLWSWRRGLIGGITGGLSGLVTGGGVGALGGAIGGFVSGGLSNSDAEAAARGLVSGLGGGLGATFAGGMIGAGVMGGGIGAAVGIGAATGTASELVHQAFNGDYNGGRLIGAALAGGGFGALSAGVGLLSPELWRPFITAIGSALSGVGGHVAKCVPGVF